jgi:hypothetical protein
MDLGESERTQGQETKEKHECDTSGTAKKQEAGTLR